jgi:hypothetical protein
VTYGISRPLEKRARSVRKMRVSAGQMMRADLFTAIRTKIRRDLHHFISKHAFYSTSAHALHAYKKPMRSFLCAFLSPFCSSAAACFFFYPRGSLFQLITALDLNFDASFLICRHNMFFFFVKINNGNEKNQG